MVAIGGNAGNPHYLPTAERVAAIVGRRGAAAGPLGQEREPGAVFADITWVGVTGRAVPGGAARAFGAIAEARDAAVRWSRMRPRRDASCEDGRWIGRRGRCSSGAGYGDRILHRTGHSLGENVHGNGVHMDDYETHDDRRVLPGTGFTVEPGLYFETFGVRTEINVFRGEREAHGHRPERQVGQS